MVILFVSFDVPPMLRNYIAFRQLCRCGVAIPFVRASVRRHAQKDLCSSRQRTLPAVVHHISQSSLPTDDIRPGRHLPVLDAPSPISDTRVTRTSTYNRDAAPVISFLSQNAVHAKIFLLLPVILKNKNRPPSFSSSHHHRLGRFSNDWFSIAFHV